MPVGDQAIALETLAIAAARRIVGAQLDLAPDTVKSIVSQVLERARRAQQVTIRVHPDDITRIEEMPQTQAATIQGDASVERGGCIVETELGQLDGRIDVQLAALERALR